MVTERGDGHVGESLDVSGVMGRIGPATVRRSDARRCVFRWGEPYLRKAGVVNVGGNAAAMADLGNALRGHRRVDSRACLATHVASREGK